MSSANIPRASGGLPPCEMGFETSDHICIDLFIMDLHSDYAITKLKTDVGDSNRKKQISQPFAEKWQRLSL